MDKNDITSPVTVITISVQDALLSLFEFSNMFSYKTLILIIFIYFNWSLF